MRAVFLFAFALFLAAPSLGNAKERSSKPNAGFLFDALNRQRDSGLTVQEFEAFLDPPRFRRYVLRQVRYKMGFFGNLPGMNRILASFGKEPPFARRNHKDWVETHDSDGDGILDPKERAAAAARIFQSADKNQDDALSRKEFLDLLELRQAKLSESAQP